MSITNNSESKVEVLKLHNGRTTDATLQTGEPTEVRLTGLRPLVDCHMHIQSLHATPLPLQWGVTILKTGVVPFRDRKTLTGFLAMFMDLGKIGRLSTDLIAKLYMHDLKNGEIKQNLYWLLLTTEEIERIEEEKRGLQEILNSSKTLADERYQLLQDFYKSTAYYYHNNQVFYLAFTMPMDLSYAHFWGGHGFPINLPVPGSKKYYFINDFTQIAVNNSTGMRGPGRVELQNTCLPGNCEKTQRFHLSYNYNLQQELERYINYMGKQYKLSGYEYNDEHFYITFDYEELSTKLKDDSILKEEKAKILEEFKLKFEKELTGKRYSHHIDDIPGDNSEFFEDYYLQLGYTEASAYRYPLQLLPFYHYDPRRYYPDGSDLTQFAKEIRRRHGFYRLKQLSKPLTAALPALRGRVDLTLFQLEGVEKDYFLEMFEDRYSIDNNGNKEKIGSASMKPNSFALNKLYPNGCFMGVKMYPALGYPGDLHNKSETWNGIQNKRQEVSRPPLLTELPYNRKRHLHPEGDYFVNQFGGLKEVYAHCIQHDLPVTAHCCPLGMTIADGFNYEIKEDIINNKKRRSQHPARESALFVDETNAHPRHWARVLDEFPELKLNLAHFGGQDVWAKTPNKKVEIPDWRGNIINLIESYNNVYTDISCFVMESNIPYLISERKWNSTPWSDLTGEEKQLMTKYYRQGVNKSPDYCLINLDRSDREKLMRVLRKADIINDDIKVIAKSLAKRIKAFPKLKERIMVGTDWYMIETAKKGVGPYYTKMFELLKLVTIWLGEQYDVWHQFAVVNPLNFIGFLEKDGKGNAVADGSEYTIKMDKVEKLAENLEKLGKNENWRDENDINYAEMINFKVNIEYKMNRFKQCKIKTAEELKKDGTLMIMGNEREEVTV